MTTADQKVERAADKLQAFAQRMAGEGGLKSKLAQPLAEDADLIRKMQPSLIKARAAAKPPVREADQWRGTHSVRPRSGPVEGVWGNREVPPGSRATRPRTGRFPQRAPAAGPKRRGYVNPWLVVGLALATGIFLAKWIDWRGHAHPRH